jgi:hypothetical protein
VRQLLALAGIAVSLIGDASATAHEPPAVPHAASEPVDRFDYRVATDSYARLFQRGMRFGPGGALSEAEFAAPLYQYAHLFVGDIDAPWRADSLDVELSGWGTVDMASAGLDERRLDGDLTIARIRHRFGFGHAAIGRQIYAGGAARVARFDGIAAGLRAPIGFGIDGYGGFTVLPRWTARPGYHLLGAAHDTLLRSPDALPDPERTAHWLAGTRAHYRHDEYGELGVSFHEQHEQTGLAQRNIGVDMRAQPLEPVTVFGKAIIDVDSGRPSDVRASVDAQPLEPLSLAASYGHLEPALFLSRQSVLSVFSTESFDEVGLEADLSPHRQLSLRGSGFLVRFASGDHGMRAGLGARWASPGKARPVLRAGYRRVREADQGYHGMRLGLTLTPLAPLRFSADSNTYLYDEEINGLQSSWVGSSGARWAFNRYVATSLSGSLARSPLARFDAQLLARLELSLTGGRP